MDLFVELVQAWLDADLRLKGTVVHERLIAGHGFTGNYSGSRLFPDRSEAPDRRRA